MKKLFWSKYLFAVLVFAPLIPISSIKAIPANPIYLAQANSAYTQYMRRGYSATKQRNYPAALSYFKQALQQRPGDRYASIAKRNIEGYIARDRRSARGRRGDLAFNSTGTPRRRSPGGVRGGGNCGTGRGGELTALVPDKGPQVTTAEHPTLFFYVPENDAEALELIVKDENNNEYTKTFKVTGEPGIISVSLASDSTVPPLEIGKTYQWSFSVICDSNDRSGNMIEEGSIQRLELDPNLSVELEAAEPHERAALYATAGLWQDTLVTMAQLRRDRPRDLAIKSDWEELLKSVGLEKIAQEPLIQCCQVEQ